MTDLERLVALEDIKLLRAKYCYFIDNHLWSRFPEIMTEDAVLDMSDPTEKLNNRTLDPIVGRDKIIGLMDAVFRDLRQLLHIVTMPQIEFESPEFATGIWRQETFVNELRPEAPGTGIAYGTVFDSYQKIDGRWWIKSVRVQLDLVM